MYKQYNKVQQSTVLSVLYLGWGCPALGDGGFPRDPVQVEVLPQELRHAPHEGCHLLRQLLAVALRACRHPDGPDGLAVCQATRGGRGENGLLYILHLLYYTVISINCTHSIPYTVLHAHL